MHETDIVLGEIRMVGKVHGALNTIVTMFEAPGDWEFKQFVSDEELRQYAVANRLVIKESE